MIHHHDHHGMPTPGRALSAVVPIALAWATLSTATLEVVDNQIVLIAEAVS